MSVYVWSPGLVKESLQGAFVVQSDLSTDFFWLLVSRAFAIYTFLSSGVYWGAGQYQWKWFWEIRPIAGDRGQMRGQRRGERRKGGKQVGWEEEQSSSHCSCLLWGWTIYTGCFLTAPPVQYRKENRPMSQSEAFFDEEFHGTAALVG